MTKRTFSVRGMTCAHCESRIEQALFNCAGVLQAKASFSTNSVEVIYDETKLTEADICNAIETEGYGVSKEQNAPHSAKVGRTMTINQFIGISVIIVAIYLIVKNTIGYKFVPEVTASMGYGMLFVVGVLTSLHCVAMCGGIALSQCMKQPESASSPWRLSLLYNLGRIVSYTVIGGIVGAIGSAVSFSGWAKGLVAILAGLFMVIVGLSMTGLFPWLNRLVPRIPKFLRNRAGKAKQGKGPFLVGLVNGFIPCGPLQSMQLYALGTGSFLAGASSMLMFSLGTVPLMFGLGTLSTMLSSRFTSRMMRVSAVLVVVLGIVMAGRGFALSGVALPSDAKATTKDTQIAEQGQNSEGVQVIASELSRNGYPEITVKKGVPVRWNLKASANDLNGCNNRLVIPAFGVEKKLTAGDNIIEFTPTESGNVAYSCWMGMIRSVIHVVDGESTQTTEENQADRIDSQNDESADNAGSASTGQGGCCASASLAPRFADGKIPSDDIAVAKIENGVQQVTITVNDQGYSPAAVVVQQGVRTVFHFDAQKLNSCNRYVYFSQIDKTLDLESGQNSITIQYPEMLGTFECAMGMLHGYIKSVEDINHIDRNAIKEEIDSYTADSGASCCS